MPGHILGEEGEGKHNSSQPTSNNLLKTSHYTHYILFHHMHTPTPTHIHYSLLLLTTHTHPPTHVHTHSPPLQIMTSHYTHPPTHTHTHTPPLQRYDQSRWFLHPKFSVPKQKNSNSRDEWYTIRGNKMFTFVAALISHKQIV